MWRIIVFPSVAVLVIAIFVLEMRGTLWVLDLGLTWGSGWWSLFNFLSYWAIQIGIGVGIYRWIDSEVEEE